MYTIILLYSTHWCLVRPWLVVTFTKTKRAFVLTFVNSPCLVTTKAAFTFVRISDLQNESFDLFSWRFTNVRVEVVHRYRLSTRPGLFFSVLFFIGCFHWSVYVALLERLCSATVLQWLSRTQASYTYILIGVIKSHKRKSTHGFLFCVWTTRQGPEKFHIYITKNSFWKWKCWRLGSASVFWFFWFVSCFLFILVSMS